DAENGRAGFRYAETHADADCPVDAFAASYDFACVQCYARPHTIGDSDGATVRADGARPSHLGPQYTATRPRQRFFVASNLLAPRADFVRAGRCCSQTKEGSPDALNHYLRRS